ncbi:MAG TPA: beta-ketoacyl-ACP synthase III [Candidatus Fermentibacter daniensis]|nr:MAG: 3-oxoacyl-ACP synthase [Candidatus Fermentibacter daniensis]MBP7719061.1 ketoacyl-ACP synthase III [Candidatus Fermentibacter sp.]OQC70010.1 MAG: 3-oxoacyl-(acyl-carrier-protein) synthase 3 [candidate division Hyd24-12 bacterium ADurb.Bin004]KZD17637.1 MAG: 3-oxoacyl-ACP synthase [Candidatus Fermentibacter daniensis]KZD19446.1 MAG: 3-oxoacyl-ACP synthase [Candidatus Fermentibacter daniensis]
MKRQAFITGTGHAVPEAILTNADLEKMVDTSDEWITTRTGIKTRHITDSNTATSDLATTAAARAMEAAGWKPEDVQALFIATVTPDHAFPATACLVADRLGLSRVPAWDFAAGCSGFVYGLIQARAFVESGIFDRILVIGAECLTKITNWKDRASCVLFGDGAGAAAISSQGPGGLLGGYHWGSDGAISDLLVQAAGGSRNPATHETVEAGMHYIAMNGSETFKHAVRAMRESCLLALEMDGTDKSDVDLLISHQANYRIIDATARALELPPEKVYVNIDRYGNTSSASIPIALDEAMRRGIITPPKTVVLAAFGAGLTWAGIIVKWNG